MCPARTACADPVRGRVADVVVADLGDRRGVAMAHAGRADDPDLRRVDPVLQRRQQRRAPSISQVRLSHTRMVSGGGGAAFSLTTSKWA